MIEGRSLSKTGIPICLRLDKKDSSARSLVRAIVNERAIAADGNVQPVAGRLDRVHARRRSDLLADDEAFPGRRRCADRREREVP